MTVIAHVKHVQEVNITVLLVLLRPFYTLKFTTISLTVCALIFVPTLEHLVTKPLENVLIALLVVKIVVPLPLAANATHLLYLITPTKNVTVILSITFILDLIILLWCLTHSIFFGIPSSLTKQLTVLKYLIILPTAPALQA